jgi:hypothetical protein
MVLARASRTLAEHLAEFGAEEGKTESARQPFDFGHSEQATP